MRKPLVNPKDAHLIKKSTDELFKINAPLPGNIMQVFVQPGDKVSKGQKLLVYEAMKMENELLAEKDGVIKTIKVKAGDPVLQDDVLVEMSSE